MKTNTPKQKYGRGFPTALFSMISNSLQGVTGRHHYVIHYLYVSKKTASHKGIIRSYFTGVR